MRRLKIPGSKQDFLTLFLGTLIVLSGVTYMASYPKVQDPFFELYVLNKDKLAANYYTELRAWDVWLHENHRWYVGVSNSMGSAQLVLIKIKIGNSTTQVPNEKTAASADLPVLFEFRRIMLPGERFESLFVWEIPAVHNKGELVYVDLNLNGTSIKGVPVGARRGENFRYIIELWTYDTEIGQYRFGWKSGAERRIAWLQMWFTVRGY